MGRRTSVFIGLISAGPVPLPWSRHRPGDPLGTPCLMLFAHSQVTRAARREDEAARTLRHAREAWPAPAPAGSSLGQACSCNATTCARRSGWSRASGHDLICTIEPL